MKRNLVKDWMTPDPIIVSPQTSVPEAHRLMRDHEIRRLPVLKNGWLVGIVSLGDIRNAEPPRSNPLSRWETDLHLAQEKVGAIMTTDPWTIAEDASIRLAAQKMLNYKIGGLPVVNARGRLVGIITESDIFRILVREWRGAALPATR